MTVHVYKRIGDRELRLFVHGAAPGQPRPGILFFHGGGWVGGTVAQFEPQSRYFATRGMVAVNAEYRLLDEKGNEPPTVCIEDAQDAMRWLRAHAGELGLDPQRIAASGGSAGAHLASYCGLMSRDPQARPTALVLFNPVFDNGPDGGYGHQRVGERYREFSPAHNVTTTAPPSVILLGTKDKLVPVRVVERFQASMQALGVRCDADYFEDQPHGFFNKEPWLSKTLAEADNFLISLGWLPPR